MQFLELVATHPKLLASFEGILAHGVQKRRKQEERRMSSPTMSHLRAAMPPRPRAVPSPIFRRRRPPTLFEVRLSDDGQLAPCRLSQ